MPQYKKGDLFKAPGVHIVTASSYLSQTSSLVMGLGAAYSMKLCYPDMPGIFGAMIKEYCGHLGTYGLLLHGTKGILQYKLHYRERPDAALICYGLKILSAVAEGRPTVVYNMNHPGLGYDKTGIPEVELLIEHLPANVHIWER